ncbi:MAG TPA: cyclic pyranopterin monophosphate synthase MoaC [Methanomicrobia archaeon]|nr:cyclic pyranopterin monophosphate synthase MoaC [Methanomicrobia archaeon]HEX58794.1 cyclic pyranopterin monophosphate synthase MoaC [Methanomicrobia archaeon]
MRLGMVDISAKEDVVRISEAYGRLRLKRDTVLAIERGEGPKGDVLSCAETAAILAVKNTPFTIPLCHPIGISGVSVDFNLGCDGDGGVVEVFVTVKSVGKTGVEMEALHGVAIALLTIWDMVKGLEKDDSGNYPTTKIEEIRVLSKVKRAEEGSKVDDE